MTSVSSSSSSRVNPYAGLITQSFSVVPSFTLESGVTLKDVPVAYKTWGRLNATRSNCLVICHALTGSADVEDWWGPLLGPDRAFDPTRFFIFCANVIGSPYGTVSSVTINPDTSRPYGPEMPGSSPKDDVRLHYQILKSLGVESVAAVVGGSMGGMTTLEWPLNSPPGFVKAIVPLATSARHSAWCISWGEAQRQSIYSDPDYRDGYYYDLPTGLDLTQQPSRGLAAARMAALLTYRSRDSFESRFGRRAGLTSKVPKGGVRVMGGKETTNPAEPGEADLARSPSLRAWREHNDGHRGDGSRQGSRTENDSAGESEEDLKDAVNSTMTGGERPPKVFSAQSYLRYQGDKFTSRFDANCYIHITRKCDAHDISHPSTQPSNPPTISSTLRSSAPTDDPDAEAEIEALHHALSLLPPALVVGVESDGLFTTTEQRELAAHIPDTELVLIPSPDGHDGFLLEFEAINEWVGGWLKRKMPSFYDETGRVIPIQEYAEMKLRQQGAEREAGKDSVFGEVEADITRW